MTTPQGNVTGTGDCSVSNEIDGSAGFGVCQAMGTIIIDRPGVTLDDLRIELEKGIEANNANNWGHGIPLGKWTGSFGGFFDCSSKSAIFVPAASQPDPDTTKDECRGIGSSQKGSIIGCRDQSLAQKVEISGTPFHLSYNSLRINKFKNSGNKVYFKIPHFPTGYEQGNRWKLKYVDVKLQIAGKTYSQQFTDLEAASWDVEFSWDGKDAQGNEVTGYTDGKVSTTFEYINGWTTESPPRIKREYDVRIGPNRNPSNLKIGDWTINAVHSYDKDSGTLYLGDGTEIKNAATAIQKTPDSLGFITIPSQDGSALYRFDSNLRHVATVETLTGVTVFSFQYTNGLLSGIVDRYNQITKIQRSADGKVSAIRNPFGVTTSLKYDISGNLAEIKNPLGFTNSFTYNDINSGGLMASMTDALGKTKYYNFNDQGRLIEALDAKGNSKKISTSESENSQYYSEYATFTSPMGRATTYETRHGWDSTKTNINRLPSGYEIQELFNGDHSQMQVRDNQDFYSTTQYVSHPLFENRQTEQWKEIYGNGGGLINFNQQYSRTDPTNPFDIGAMTEVRTLDGIGSYTTTFDKASRTFTTTTPLGKQAKTTLNAKGLTSRAKYPGLEPITMQYNARGQLTSVSQGSRSYSMTYNPQGFLATLSNPLGHVTTYNHDLAGQLTAFTLPNGKNFQFTYNGNGDQTSITPAGGSAYSYGFDDNRNLILNTEPMIGERIFAWSWTYNTDDQPTQMLKPNSAAVDLTYDEKGNLRTLTGPGVNRTYAWTNGALQSISNSSGVELFFRQGRLPIETTWSGPVQGSVFYVWGAFDRLSKIKVNGIDESAVSYTYDADGDLLEANDLAFTRNSLTGRVTRSVVPGIVTTHSYDTYGAETETAIKVKGIELRRFQYTYDQLGRIATRTTTQSDGTSSITEYTYDPTGQLLSETTDGISRTYSYTDNGNRLTTAGQETYDAHDRMVSDATWNYTYNLGGHLRRKDNKVDGSWVTYQYDALGNLLGVEFSNGTKVRYLVDGMNRRIRTKLNDQFKSAFIYQDGLRPIAQLNPNGTVKAMFVYGHRLNVPDLMVKAGVSYRIISDHLGSPMFVIREGTGQVMQEIKYDTWGNVLSDSNPGFQPFGFAGGLYDSTTGLVRFGARDYDPSIGRWLNKDPIRFDGGWNVYVYAYNNPVNLIDSDGLRPDDPAYWPAPPGAIEPSPEGVAMGFGIGIAGGASLMCGAEVLGPAAARTLAPYATIRGGELVLKGRSGAEILRINPFGDAASTNPFGRKPHYHRTRTDPLNPGQTAPGQGRGRHRPWEEKSTDKSFWDRF